MAFSTAKPRDLHAPLKNGDKFVVKLGPRRVLGTGWESYFQHDNRRYLCRVVTWRDEPYRPSFQWTATRRVLTVEVIGA